MSEKKPHAKATPVDTRDALLRAAKRVFAQKGYEGATVKDLADEAHVNVSLVSYHFGGKEGLYRTCLEGFGLERVEAAERVLNAPKSKDDLELRLRLFGDDFLAIHLRDPDTCRMIHRGMETLDPISSEAVKGVFYRIFEALLNFVDSAKKNGLLKADIDIEIATGLLFGSLMHMIRSQPIARLLGKRTYDDPAYRARLIEQWVETFTRGNFAP